MRGAAARGYDRQAGGEGFKHRKAESVGRRGEEKSVRGGVGGGEVFALQDPGKDRGGATELAFEVSPGRTVTHEGEPGSWHVRQDRLESLDAFLGREAADVEQESLRRVPIGEPLAPFVGCLVRVEAQGVHPLRPQAYPLHALLKEVVHRGLRGAEVYSRPVVELPGPPPR